MSCIILKNARIFDGVSEECPEDRHVLIEGKRIREISDRPISTPNAIEIDLRGRTLMPGLIDCHTHVYLSSVDMSEMQRHSEAYAGLWGARMLEHALRCGFTTIRDIGGGDYGMSKAINDGLIKAPRFFYAGKILSMTGGHGDFRAQHEHDAGLCSCRLSNRLCHIVDGADNCRAAAREELRKGAHCIKIMASGGVLSPTDPIWMDQYTELEISAVIEECARRRTYAAAHCHPASSIRRCAELGVRSIEHGTLIDAETAAIVAEKGAFVVPTLSIAYALVEDGPALGLPKGLHDKAREIFGQMLQGLEIMKRANVPMAFGTDLIGDAYTRRTQEFTLRAEALASIDILRSATSVGARLMQMEDAIGCVRADAFADLIAVDGDPLADISLLSADEGRHISLIALGGRIMKNDL